MTRPVSIGKERIVTSTARRDCDAKRNNKMRGLDARLTAPGTQHLDIPIVKAEWLLQNHRIHYMEEAQRKRLIRRKAGWLAKKRLLPVRGPVAVYARARIPKGPLPDADSIAKMVKAALDGIVDAGIIPDDSGDHVPLVGYGRPERDRTLPERTLALILTDQYVPF